MSNSKRIDDIEILRGFAVVIVALHHMNGSLYRFPAESIPGAFFQWFAGGAGVDLFFAISGFVIARSMLPRYPADITRADFKQIAYNFWVRRIFRLLPSAWLWLGIILLLSAVYNDSGAFGTLKANLEGTVAGVLQIANFRFADGFKQYPLGSSFHYWSLSLEEQFYLLFPFLALLGRRALVVVLVAAILFQMYQPRGYLVWYLMFRTDAICFGVLVAIMHTTPWFGRLKKMCTDHALIVALLIPPLLAVVAAAGSHGADLMAYKKNYIAVASLFLVLFASMNFDVVAKVVPRPKMWVWIGTHSYAIYLIHVPIFRVVKETYHRIGADMSSTIILAVVVSVGLIAFAAHLNFRFVESPLRKWGADLADRKFGGRQAA
jgi:peptidoglycan/LPS O-acetylase OafA/YrhL